jgi:putative membrane protein
MTIGLAALSMLLLPSAKAQTDQDKTFLTRASQSDFDEIQLSQLAAGKTNDSAVKAFANKMVTDHTALEQQMKPFADKWGLSPASSLDPEHQAIYEKLNGLSGKDFDKEYMRAMDKDHHMALTEFQSEHQTTKLPDFKQAVGKGEKVIAQHTKMADHLAGKLGVASPDANNDNNPAM